VFLLTKVAHACLAQAAKLGIAGGQLPVTSRSAGFPLLAVPVAANPVFLPDPPFTVVDNSLEIVHLPAMLARLSPVVRRAPLGEKPSVIDTLPTVPPGRAPALDILPPASTTATQ